MNDDKYYASKDDYFINEQKKTHLYAKLTL